LAWSTHLWFIGSAILGAVLPTVILHDLRLGALGLGLVMGCSGIGAVIGTTLSPDSDSDGVQATQWLWHALPNPLLSLWWRWRPSLPVGPTPERPTVLRCTGRESCWLPLPWPASGSDRGEETAPYASYLAAFQHGMPPHGGFAIGLERWTSRVLGLDNVRQATLFPRDRHRLTP
jgi:hypothetical protein